MVLTLAISSGEAILIIVLAAIPIGAISFALGAGNALGQIGKGQFAIEQEIPQKDSSAPPHALREAEIRQMLEAKAYRQRARGEAPLDIDAEVARLMSGGGGEGASLRRDAQLVAEVRALVVARNQRRSRQGKQPLDVDAEVDRQLRELEGLGQ
jgi:hypothetical protein